MLVRWLQSDRAGDAAAAAATAAFLLPVRPHRLSISPAGLPEARLKREGVKSSEAQSRRAKVNVFFPPLAAAAALFVIHENGG